MIWWPKRVKHKSVYQNTKQFPKTQISLPKHKSISQNTNQFTKTQNNFLKHKPIFQNTNQFTKTQINFTKHKPISRNTNQKTGHLLCHYQRAWKGLNKCTFSAKQYFGIYFWFFSITFFISDKRLPLFDFPFCNPNSDFLFFNLITVFLKGILPVNFSL